MNPVRRYTVFVALLFTLSAPLLALGQVSPPPLNCASLPRNLSLGSAGPAVTALQKFLFTQYQEFPSPTGYFGPTTEAATKQWQREHRISATGSVGPLTASAMKLCTAATPALVTTASGAASTRTLSRSMSGSDVTALQQFLISQNLLTAGSATGYFGALTEAAVQKFQSQQGIVSSGTPSTTGYGSVGAKTRGAIANVRGSRPQSKNPNPNPIISPNPGGGGGWGGTPPPAPAIPIAGTTSCVIGATTLKSGQSQIFYSSATIKSPAACASISQTRTCANGSLTGSYAELTCEQTVPTPPGPQASCTQDGETLASGSKQSFYSSKTVAYGSLCSSVAAVRTCANGALSGDAAYQYAACAVSAPAPCTFNGQTIASGASVTAYLSSSVPSGKQCVSESRVCGNGTLSGSYSFSSCAPQGTPPCIINASAIGGCILQ